MSDDEHGDVCEDCEGTGRVQVEGTLKTKECDDCWGGGVLSSDQEMCDLAQCDFCSDPSLRDDPAAKFR